MQAILVNASKSRTSIALWMTLAKSPDTKPVAWISALLAPGSYSIFKWGSTYEYVWADTGTLIQGKTIGVAERMTATAPTVQLQKHGAGYRFVAVNGQAKAPGDLTISTTGDIPQNRLSIGINLRIDSGIGQPGDAVNVVQAQPNLDSTWTVGERYFANFGSVAQSEYDPVIFGLQTPLELDISTSSDVVVLLDQTNTLQQLKDSSALSEMRQHDFSRSAPKAPGCG
jgi:hypothetical protein